MAITTKNQTVRSHWTITIYPVTIALDGVLTTGTGKVLTGRAEEFSFNGTTNFQERRPAGSGQTFRAVDGLEADFELKEMMVTGGTAANATENIATSTVYYKVVASKLMAASTTFIDTYTMYVIAESIKITAGTDSNVMLTGKSFGVVDDSGNNIDLVFSRVAA